MKIIKIVATRCQVVGLKCNKLNFGWNSAPDPAGGASNAPQDALADSLCNNVRGLLLKGKEKEGVDGGEGSPLRFPTHLRPCFHVY